MYPGKSLYREKNPNKQFLYIAKIMYDHSQNIHHENSALKELAKLTLT